MSADSGSTSSSSTPEDADFNPAPPRRPRQSRPGSASKRVRQVESPDSGDEIDDAGDSLMPDAPAVAASDEAASRASSAFRRSSGELQRPTELKSPSLGDGAKHSSPETETEAVPDSEDGGDDDSRPLEAPAMVPSNSRQLSQSDLSELASSVKSLSPPVARRRARPARQTGPDSASQGASNGAGKSKASLAKYPSVRKAGGSAGDMERTASRSTADSGGEEIHNDEVPERDQSESEEEPLGWGTTPAFRRRAAAAAALKQAPTSASKGKAVVPSPKKRERVSESRSPGSSLTGATDSDEPDATAKSGAVVHGDDSDGTSGVESSDSDAPDSAAFPTTKPSSNAMRGRGRPRGAKRGGGKLRTAVSAAGGHTSETTKKRGRGGSNTAAFKGRAKPPGSPFDAAGSPGVRATRATVTLPPGYIEGVKSARMTRVRSASSTPAPRATPQATAEPEELELEHDASSPRPEPDPELEPEVPPSAQYQPQAVKGRKGFKGKEKELVKDEVVDVDLVLLVKEEDDAISPPEPEVSVETPRAPTPLKEKGTPAKDKGKERAFTYEPERTLSKRRKVDAEAIARAAERAAARVVLLEQLETEAQKIRDATHPLIEFTYDQLDAEKAVRLAQLAKSLEQQERDYDKILYADSQTVWRQWADAKDTLRTDMYLDNQEQLKQLIYEEKAYPFLRDHPLLVNTHGLPPVPYYRGPLSPEAAVVYPPRTDVYTGYTLEPPPLNHALDHNAWALSAGEIEDDMATLADYSASTIIPAPPLPRYPINPYAFGAQGPPPTAPNGYRAPGYAPHPPPFYPPMASSPWPGAYDGSSGPANPPNALPSSSVQHATPFNSFPAMRTFDKGPPKSTQWSHSQPPSSTASTSAPARHSSSQPPPRHDAHSNHYAPPTSTAVPSSKSKNLNPYSAFGPPSASPGPLPHASATAAVSPPVPQPPKATRPPNSWYAIPGGSNNSYAPGAGGAPPPVTVPASQKPSWAVDLPPRKDQRQGGGNYPYW